MAIYETDPISDPRWQDFVAKHSESSIFHTPGWLRALKDTYGYEPVVLTEAEPDQPLTNGLVFCRVESWITGWRLVSLPFADHCDALVDRPAALRSLLGAVKTFAERKNYDYVEFRSDQSGSGADNLKRAGEFYFHVLDLTATTETLLANLHKSCMQRPIKRAQRLGVACEVGRSETLLQEFYKLQLLTRRRHRLPAQPLAWFRNLVKHLGNSVTFRIARQGDRPLGAIVTTEHRDTITYKYGCSDAQYHRLGVMPLLLWSAVLAGKERGLTRLDLGRSDQADTGLIRFKDHLGATRLPLRYYRSGDGGAQTRHGGWSRAFSRSVYPLVPASIISRAGSGLYRHFG